MSLHQKVKKVFCLLSVIVSVVMMAAGAVNLGMTRWFLSVPFMLWLVYLAGKRLERQGFNLIGILGVIVINTTALSNPWIVAQKGSAIQIEAGCAWHSVQEEKKEKEAQGIKRWYIQSYGLDRVDSESCEPLSDQVEMRYIAAGRYKIVEMQVPISWNMRVQPVVQLEGAEQLIDARVNIQSRWSAQLSMLMMYPWIPIAILTWGYSVIWSV